MRFSHFIIKTQSIKNLVKAPAIAFFSDATAALYIGEKYRQLIESHNSTMWVIILRLGSFIAVILSRVAQTTIWDS
jgi:hypothetical protein